MSNNMEVEVTLRLRAVSRAQFDVILSRVAEWFSGGTANRIIYELTTRDLNDKDPV